MKLFYMKLLSHYVQLLFSFCDSDIFFSLLFELFMLPQANLLLLCEHFCVLLLFIVRNKVFEK